MNQKFGIPWDLKPVELKLSSSAIIDGDALHLPIETKYSLSCKILESEDEAFNKLFDIFPVRNYFAGDSKIKLRLLHFDSTELAISDFLLDEYSDPWIVALFEAPHLVEFLIKEIRIVEVFEEQSLTISSSVIRRGEELKQEFFQDSQFKEAYEEIKRVQTEVERHIQEDEQQRLKDKRESFYRQWEWLEKKRAAGEFDEFMSQ